jgi:hypothetical protein
MTTGRYCASHPRELALLRAIAELIERDVLDLEVLDTHRELVIYHGQHRYSLRLREDPTWHAGSK